MRKPIPTATRAHLGFTLVELLVVISIIAVLMSLLAAGVFQYLEAQTASNTETTIRTVSKVLQQHWKAVVDAADKEDVPQKVQLLATNGPQTSLNVYYVSDPQLKRARVIWKTLRLIQEFPLSYAEASTPARLIASDPVYGSLAATLSGKNPYINTVNALKPPILPKPPYPDPTKLAPGSFPLPQAWVNIIGPPVPGYPSDTPVPYTAGEASVCLLMALQETRGGVAALSAENLHSGAKETYNPGVRQLVDGWGNPIVLYRFPTANAELDATLPGGKVFRNPLDPEGALMNPAWNNAKTFMQPICGVYWFEKLCHTIHKGSGSSYMPASFYAPPVIASSGRDGAFGLNNELFSGHVDMSISTTATPNAEIFTHDNIYSYLLK